MICRKYGFLRSRILLYRQDELRQLERDLLEADQEDAQDCPLALRSRKTDEERPQDAYSRKPLLEKIDAKLKEYGEILNLFWIQRKWNLTRYRLDCKRTKELPIHESPHIQESEKFRRLDAKRGTAYSGRIRLFRTSG